MIFDFIFMKCDTIKIAKCLREGRGEDGYGFGYIITFFVQNCILGG